MATRNVTTSLQTALSADSISPFFAFKLEFDSGTLYLWTGLGDQSIGGQTYTGTGAILQVSEVTETSDMEAVGAKLTLTGLDSSILSLALTEAYQGRPATIYFGVVSDLTEMTEIFSGYMDTMGIAETGNTCTIEMTIENKLTELEKVRAIRYTSAYQKNQYPGDLGMDFIEDLQDKKITWGRKSGEVPTQTNTQPTTTRISWNIS